MFEYYQIDDTNVMHRDDWKNGEITESLVEIVDGLENCIKKPETSSFGLFPYSLNTFI
ncbi:hypothetical protein QE357_000002 [Siphonobacter sp. BAB-5404]|nr:hypothetical protein [Siphonobacter sp. SORGH_AS_1065]MDR6192950.1 hypothetical protein [Siphonobacter sp. SORGH_AS_0500]